MESYDWTVMINGLYEQLVRYNKDFTDEQGIWIRVTIKCSSSGYDKNDKYHPDWENEASHVIHIIMLKHHQIFIHVSKSYGLCSNLPNPDMFVNESNHDSCWRDAIQRKLTEVKFSVHSEAYKKYPKGEKLAPYKSGIRFSINHGLMGPIFKFVEVTKIPDPTLDTTYFNKLTSVQVIEKTITIKR